MIHAVLAAWAGEHALNAPSTPAVAGRPAPEGPPRVVEIEPGEPLQARLSALPPGSTARLAAGVHRGPVVIDRSLRVVGHPGAVVDGGGVGTVVTLAADGITLTGLRIRGGGHQPQQDDAGVVVSGRNIAVEQVTVEHVYLGIDLRQATSCRIRDNRVVGDPEAPFGLRGDGIRLWESDHNEIVGNTLTDVRDLVVWYSDDNVIADNVVSGSRYGAHLMHTFRNTIRGNQLVDDVVGVFVMYSAEIGLVGNLVVGARGEAGVGFGLKESDALWIEDNVLVDNTTALYLDTTPHRVDGRALVRNNRVAGNEVGIRFHGPSSGAEIVDNVFASNRVEARVDSSRKGLSGVTFARNHWSAYAGYDLDGDGFGDLPYEGRSTTAQLLERSPALAWLHGTPTLGLLELFGAAFPLFAPTVWFVDPQPRMEAP